jgi:hypothetical protein
LKKTYKKLTPTLEQVTVENGGQEFIFLNGVIQMQTGGRFIPAKSPMDGELMLIIEDYVHWHTNQEAMIGWIREHGAGIRQQGMVLHFENDADRTMFLLRWG